MRMRRSRYWIVAVVWVLSFYIGWAFGHGDRREESAVYAQGAQVTPASWTAIGAPFPFLYRYPETIGWAYAEDKRGDTFVKGYIIGTNVGVCLRWQDVAGTPGAFLTRNDKNCSDGLPLSGGIYWFATAPNKLGTPTSTVTLTLTPTPLPTGEGPTPTATRTLTPSPLPTGEGPTPPTTRTRTPTPGPVGTPVIIPGTPEPICNAFVGFYGVDDRVKWGNVPSVHYDGTGGGCGSVTVLMEKRQVITQTGILLNGLLDELVREKVLECLRHPATCPDLNTPIPTAQ